ncbi:MAG: anti-sigma regulatory factor [Anaerolineae bacterium]|nr:anti-sigma regulatory factor [Anaerolineae bacterium]
MEGNKGGRVADTSQKIIIIEESITPVYREVDVILVCHRARALAVKAGFDPGEQTALNIAIAEIARNIVKYAVQGEMVLRRIQDESRQGVQAVARDQGPGIPNIDLALQNGYTTSDSLGMGLPGAKRLVDEFDIISEVGRGTTVVMTKWKRAR